jgi:hypothetical protein
VCSPTQLSDALGDEIKALGSVQHLVSPNMLYHLLLAEWVWMRGAKQGSGHLRSWRGAGAVY